MACFAALREPVAEQRSGAESAERRSGKANVLDLGTGCGVVGLGLLLRYPRASFSVLGVDHDPQMIQAAQSNAMNLGFDQRFTVALEDIRKIGRTTCIAPEGYDLVLCNPPYRPKGHGRMPVNKAKRSSRFEVSASIEDFTHTAAKALKTRGRLALIHLPEHLGRIIAALQAHNLAPKRLRFVHGHQHRPACLFLVEARKASRPGLQVEPPLVLYRRLRPDNALTDEALAFCPFLGTSG